MEWDCETGSKDSVILPVLQLASRGVRALACTDCLNFGNPEKKNIMGQLVSALQSLDSACRAFDVPIISGNVSLYNETLGQNIVPTPSTGIVGLRDEPKGAGHTLSEAGLEIYLVRTQKESAWLGEYAAFKNESPQGSAHFDLTNVVTLQNVFLQLAKFCNSSQVISKGGLFNALVKLSGGEVGLEIQIEEKARTLIETLFAERFYSAVWALSPQDAEKFESICDKHKDQLSYIKLGHSTSEKSLKVNKDLNLSLDEIKAAQGLGLERWL